MTAILCCHCIFSPSTFIEPLTYETDLDNREFRWYNINLFLTSRRPRRGRSRCLINFPLHCINSLLPFLEMVVISSVLRRRLSVLRQTMSKNSRGEFVCASF